ncbi:hypothetical protein GBAR_LOCUS25235 [Geodia barretti]|uniref:Uncharacterized protein n=1 Tax=Geodia barretti TaxID=519541 RepID=A0AA35X500_GEOBA|nr:hypothetical protein GBAR_LOCUS25235 [Geodia barretti]
MAEVEGIEVSDEDVQSEADRLIGLSSEESEQANLENLQQFLGLDSTRDSIRSSLHSKLVMDRLTDIALGNLEDESVEPTEEERESDVDTEDADAVEATGVADTDTANESDDEPQA